MSTFYDNSDTLYLTVQALNSSQTDGNSIQCTINQQSNPIVKNLSDYDLYLQSITCSTSELPYCNFLRNVSWDPNNFVNNISNLVISIIDDDPNARPFNLIGNVNPAIVGCGNNTGRTWQGVSCYVQYLTENSPLPNNNTATYPRSYWNIHSIQQFLDLINTAIYNISTVNGSPIAGQSIYFYYDPISQLYQLNTPQNFCTTYNMYANVFLEKYLDNFRWSFQKTSTVVAPPLVINNSVSPYNGLDYIFVAKQYPVNLVGGVYTYLSEYNGLANLVDVHSILITSNSGQLQQVVQQILPASISGTTTTQTQNQLQQPTISAIKSLDIILTDLSQINNSYIQFEASQLSFPINTISKDGLTLLDLTLKIQNIDNTLYPLQLGAGGGYCNIKLALKKKNKK